MTLAVARISEGKISVAADTLLTEHNTPLPLSEGTVKICLLPGNLCAAFSNSPERAKSTFDQFIQSYPEGCGFAAVIKFFEEASAVTGNDFLLAFGDSKRIIKIVDGERQKGTSSTQWIGDKSAWDRFQEINLKYRRGYFHQRAITAAMFAEEPLGSSASNLYAIMSSVAKDKDITTVGGLITVATCRGPSFRFSVFSEMLYDWPNADDMGYEFSLSDKIVLRSTGENASFSISQISPLYMNANFVAYYFTSGGYLIAYYGERNSLANRCLIRSGIAPDQINKVLEDISPIDLQWMVWIMEPQDNIGHQYYSTENYPDSGIRFAVKCLANTCRNDSVSGILSLSN